METTAAIALRGVLKKEGLPDILFELRSQPDDFQMFVNGKEIGRYYRTYSPQQLISGNCPPMSIKEAWQGSVAKHFPGYVASNMEELS